MIVIIDGYNVMHTLEQGAGLTADELEAKRDSFIESVINTSSVSGDESIIVFDSSRASGHECQRIPNTPVTVCFASAKESADILIGQLVQKHLAASKEGRIRVVSADWEVQKGAMMARVERVPPRHFLAEIKNFEKGVAKSPKMDRIRWKLEHKVDVETLRKLEEMRRGRG